MTFVVPVASDTIYNVEAVLSIVKDELDLRNYRVTQVGYMLLIRWGGGC